MDRDVWLWWIELVHEDPARDLVLWASDEDERRSTGRVRPWQAVARQLRRRTDGLP